MTDDEIGRIEDALRKLGPKPAPPELRDRVLEAAFRARRTDRAMTPGSWRLAAGCALLITAAMAGDLVLTSGQGQKIEALLALPAPIRAVPEAERSVPDVDKPILDEVRDIAGPRGMFVRRSDAGRPRGSGMSPRAELAAFLSEEGEIDHVHSKGPR
jgi:hypothetical protein